MFQEQTRKHGIRKVVIAAPLPLEAHFKVAGTTWLIGTNSPAILRAAEQIFEFVDGKGLAPDLSLRLTVNFDLADKRPWPKPHFRGMNHLIYASYSSGNTMLIDLLHRSVIGSISPDMAQDAQYWKYVLLPVLVGSCSAAIGITPLHCACLVKNRVGLLLGGESGAGKSTLALSLALKGFAFLSDDWTYFKRSTSGVTAWGLPTVVKLLPDAVKYFPKLASVEPHTSLNGELAFEVDPVSRFGVRQSRYCEVGKIVFLERTGGTDKIAFRRISSDEAFTRFVIDLETLPGCISSMRTCQLETVKNIVSRECWVLRHGDSPDSVAREIERFSNVSAGPAGIQEVY
ncbi:MAG: Hpr(Ser) kinase/phosphatase [Acidobacteriaceae bacterium]|nr:Hpr(Ser) kinase/phosphatase [Acidobacteriaceae bacterium]